MTPPHLHLQVVETVLGLIGLQSFHIYFHP